jgi:hypothetical protein
VGSLTSHNLIGLHGLLQGLKKKKKDVKVYLGKDEQHYSTRLHTCTSYKEREITRKVKG